MSARSPVVPLALAALALAASGCGGCYQHDEGSGETSDILQRMVDQQKYLPYQSNPFFADERAMRTPPPGTVSREGYQVDRVELRGNGPSEDAGYSTKNPLTPTAELLKTGQRHFNVYCATCHGLLGDGNSIIARNVSQRPPPSLHQRASMPDGFFYDAITYGYGVMPPYSEQLSAVDRWAVVMYLRALQRSQRASVDDAPPEVRQQLQQAPEEARP